MKLRTNNWVVDASPIILLAKINLLGLLQQIPDNLCIPVNVAAEILQADGDDQATMWLQQDGKAYVRDEATVSPLVSKANLGMGECEVLSFAFRNKEWTAVIDDLAARKYARSLSIPYTGTLGIIIAANRKGLIQNVVSIFNQLIDAGFYISPNVVKKAIALSKQDH